MIQNSKILTFVSDKSDRNIAFHVEDTQENVTKNRIALAQKYSYNNANLVYMQQTHSNHVACVDHDSDKLQLDTDALITNKKNLPLMVMVADCIPIVFFDSSKEVIAVAHAGRNGVYTNIVSNVVHLMCSNYSSEAQDIEVYLGPSIQKCCYEVSEELAQIAVKSFGTQFVDGRLVDLQGICKQQLVDVGILEKNIEIEPYCTKCNPAQQYFSYRVDADQAGRFGAVIMLKGN